VVFLRHISPLSSSYALHWRRNPRYLSLGIWASHERKTFSSPFLATLVRILLPHSFLQRVYWPRFSHTRKEISSKRVSITPTRPKLRPLTLDLRSGWDDEKIISTIQSSNSSIKSISPMKYSSPTQSNRNVADNDAAFIASTLSYVGSPTAKALGITSPLDFRPPASHILQPLAIPLRRSSRPSFPESHQPILRAMPSAHLPVDIDPDMDLTSVLDESWPLPPLSPVSSRSVSQYSCPSPPCSRSNSPASSPVPLESFTYPLRPTVTPPHRRIRPFEGSSISSFEIDPTTPITPPRKSSMRQHHAIRTLHRAFSKERLGGQGQALGGNEVIHMTVVQESFWWLMIYDMPWTFYSCFLMLQCKVVHWLSFGVAWVLLHFFILFVALI